MYAMSPVHAIMAPLSAASLMGTMYGVEPWSSAMSVTMPASLLLAATPHVRSSSGLPVWASALSVISPSMA